MFDASSAVTYTSVYTDSEPWRYYEEDSAETGPLRVIVYGYDGLPIQPMALLSSDYVPRPEHPPSPDYVPDPEHPPSPIEIPYPLPADALPIVASTNYVADTDPEEDPEDDQADYPADGGDGDDEPSDDDDDDDTEDEDPEEEPFEEDDEEEEEHPAPAYSSTVPIIDHVLPAGDTEALEADEPRHAPGSPISIPLSQTRLRKARKTVRPEPPMSASIEACIARHVALLSPPLLIPSLPLPFPSPLTTSLTNIGAPLGYRVAGIRMRALLPSTSCRTDVPEADMPPQKKACFITPTPGFKIGESYTAGDARQPGPTESDLRRCRVEQAGYRITDTWDEIVDKMMEIASTTLEGVNERVTELDTIVRQRTDEFETCFEDAQYDRALPRAQVNTLFGDRPDHRRTTMLMDREVMYSREAWAFSMDKSSAIAAHVRTLEIQALIDRGVAAALAERDAYMSRNGDNNNDSRTSRRRQMTIPREYSYTDFLKCQPMSFQGTEGVVESAKVERYIVGLPDMIHGSVKASKPQSMQESIEFATNMMDKKMLTHAERQTEHKRKFDDTSRNTQHQQQPPKRNNVARAYTAGQRDRKPYGGTKPLCPKFMFDASSAVTYTSVYTDSEPWRYYEEDSAETGPLRPLPADASPIVASANYVADSDPEEDPEDDQADYPADGGDGDDEPSDDDDDDDTNDEDPEEEPFEEDDEEEEEHPAPAYSSTVPIIDHVLPAGDTEALEADEPRHAPGSPISIPFSQTRLRKARKTVRPEPPMSASIEACIARHVALLSPPLLIPSLPLPFPSPFTTSLTNIGAPLGYRATGIRMRALLPSTSCRTDVPEVDMPPQKKACFITPTPRFKIGRVIQLDEIVDKMMEIASTTLEGVNERVTELDTTVRQRTDEFETRFEDAQYDRALSRAQVNTLFGDRPDHRCTTMLMDKEAMYSREAWAFSMDRSSAIAAHVRTLETQVAALITQTTSLQTQLTTTLGRIKILEARDPEPQEGLAEAGSSCVAAALAERDAYMNRNGDNNNDSRTSRIRQMTIPKECSYTDFLKCQPMSFQGTEGVVVMSDASSAVTYTSVYMDSKPLRYYGEDLAETEPPRVIVYGYDGLPIQPVAPPSLNYVPGPKHPPSPDYVPDPEHPPSPIEIPYVPEPEYPEYLAPSDDEEPLEDQSLPVDASPIVASPDYVANSNPEEDPEEDPEDDQADYPADGGDGDDEPFDDDDDDDTDDEDLEEEDDDKEEEHPAPADSPAVPIVVLLLLARETEALEADEPTHAPGSHISIPLSQTRLRRARKTVRPEPPMSASMEACIARQAALLSPPLLIPSLPMRALLPSTSRKTDILEANMPPRKKACFTAPAPGFKIGESSVASVARQLGPTESDLRRCRVEQAGYGITDTEAMYSCEAWAFSMDRSSAIAAHVRTLETQVAALITQTMSLQTQLTTTLRHIEVLEARDPEPQEGPAEAGSSC
nr:hypothetical protein [Tanacetum cinerariifolium]